MSAPPIPEHLGIFRLRENKLIFAVVEQYPAQLGDALVLICFAECRYPNYPDRGIVFTRTDNEKAFRARFVVSTLSITYQEPNVFDIKVRPFETQPPIMTAEAIGSLSIVQTLDANEKKMRKRALDASYVRCGLDPNPSFWLGGSCASWQDSEGHAVNYKLRGVLRGATLVDEDNEEDMIKVYKFIRKPKKAELGIHILTEKTPFTKLATSIGALHQRNLQHALAVFAKTSVFTLYIQKFWVHMLNPPSG